MVRRWQAAFRACKAGLAVAPVGAASFSGAWPSQRLQFSSCQGKTKRDTHDKQAEFWLSGASAGSESVLASKYDLYGGVIVNPERVPKDVAAFRDILTSSLSEWQRQNKRGIWLQVSIDDSALIPIATKDFGFEFHHAEREYLMLTKWLPVDAPNTLPPNASHTVGVGAIVTDASGRILLVRESSGPAAKLGIWKLPTGLVDAGEELHQAALREVKEETGVDAMFERLGAFTMSHGGNLAHAGKSNLFFVVKCRAVTTEISTQQSEIAEARWFTREEFDSLPFPEKNSIWDALNRSAFDGNACLEAKQLPWGRSRPDTIRWFYYPAQTSAL
eukprot:TRINITY_DN6754_c2_g1_i1.p1 TRINITY_DN6754_c2_g1~~TRINITY_DN6754_c2_g1_i1.p1  ORF type:complete len:331 (+),score=52.18 TRINITY_DN6754_c2_g1_i1:147-1139(+)